MMSEEFQILAAKVLANEATAEEQARLGELLAQDTAARQAFQDLQASWTLLREGGPLLEAMQSPGPAPIPPDHLARLQQKVRNQRRVTSASDQSGRSSDRSGVEQESFLGLLIQTWLRRARSSSPVLVSLLLLFAVALLFLLLNLLPTHEPVVVSHGSPPAAYLLAGEGVEVRRDLTMFIAPPATELGGQDKIRLGRYAQATFVTPAGMIRLEGPQQITVATLSAAAMGSSGAHPVNNSNSFPNEMVRLALFQPLHQVHATPLLLARRGDQDIPLYSPAGATASLTPQILWKNQPGKTYDLVITDEYDPHATPLRWSAVVSPVGFAEVIGGRGKALVTNGLFRLRISETGRPITASEYTFRTTSPGGVPMPDKLGNALAILISEPARVGDALADLLTLPDPAAHSELALRLKLLAFGQLGYKDDFDGTLLRLPARQ